MGKQLETLTGHSDRVNSVSVSPNGKLIVSASDDRTVKLWSHDGQLLQTLKGHNAKVLSVSFSPKSNLIASSAEMAL